MKTIRKTAWDTYDCINCGIVVTKRNTARQYCSHKCQMAYQKKEKVYDLKNGYYIGKMIWAKEFGGKRRPTWFKEFLLEWNDYQCQECGVGDFYNGKHLTLQVEHIDGKCMNNDLENLCLLCPNCHTQTATWGNKRGPGASDRTERYA